MYIIDAHQDIAYNMLLYGRDYKRSVAETRAHERATHSIAIQHNGDTLLGWPEYQLGQVAVIITTLFAPPDRQSGGEWNTQAYRTTPEAHQRYQAQLDVYHRLVDDYPDQFALIQTRQEFVELVARWEEKATAPPEAAQPPVGLIISIEGAEGIQQVPAELEMWWQRGVRLIGPAWAGNRFCGGTREPGPLTKAGHALLAGMADLGFTLDISHMDPPAALRALEVFEGRVIASHANAAAVVKDPDTNRHLPDEAIRLLIERQGVIGVVPFNLFLHNQWKMGDRKEAVSLDLLVAQIDYICQLAGNAQHVGLGSDFDGGFGWQSVPAEIDTIVDLNKIAPLLRAKGYSEANIAAIFGKNWYAVLEQALP